MSSLPLAPSGKPLSGFSSVQVSRSVVSDSATPWTAARQASLSITNSWSLLKHMSIQPVMSSNHLILCCLLLSRFQSFPGSRSFQNPTISSSVTPFSCPQSFPVSGSFQMSQLSASGGQNIGVSASTSVLSMNIQDWFPLGWTDWISLQSKGLSRVFSNITVQKHQFFCAQPSSQSNSHIYTWLLEKP